MSTAPRTRPHRPYATLALVGTALALAWLPEAAGALAWQRAELARGELWRGLTGHLVHGSLVRLLVLDLGLLLVAGAWLERRSRTCFLVAVLGSALAASAALALLSDVELYIGSSALVCGVLGAGGWSFFRESDRAWGRGLVLLAVGLFLVKSAAEALGWLEHGVVGLPAGVKPSVVAHVFGAAGGVVAAASQVAWERVSAGAARAGESRVRALRILGAMRPGWLGRDGRQRGASQGEATPSAS